MTASDDVLIELHLSPGTVEKIDAWRLSQPEAPTREAAVRMIIADWLVGHGMLPPEIDDD